MFAPVATVSLLPHIMVVGPSVPAKTVAEFVAYAKANPGKLNYGAGLGTPPHLLSTLFKTKAGIDVTYVPYKGSAHSVTDLLAGQTHFTIDGMLILMPQIQAGKLQARSRSRARSAGRNCPMCRRWSRAAIPDFTIDAWTGVVAPAGTLAADRRQAQRRHQRRPEIQEVQDALTKFSSLAKVGTPQDFSVFLKDQMQKWAAMVKLAGAKAE